MVLDVVLDVGVVVLVIMCYVGVIILGMYIINIKYNIGYVYY